MTVSPIILASFLACGYFATTYFKKRVRPTPEELELLVLPADLTDSFTEKEIMSFKEVFWTFDTDGSGNIDRVELRDIFLSVDPDVDELIIEGRIDKMLKEGNREGGDENIDFGEVPLLWRRASG